MLHYRPRAVKSTPPIVPLLFSPPSTLSQKHFLGSKYFKILHENFRDMGGAVLGGGGGHTFRDMGGAVLRYGRCCIGGWRGGAYIPRYGRCCAGGWRGSYISRYGRGCFEILEVLFYDMGGAEISFGRRGNILCRIGGLVVSVRACGMSGPSSNLDPFSFF